MIKKDCFHCIRFRPRKGNVCFLTKTKINEYHSYYCDDFKDDTTISKLTAEEEIRWDIKMCNINK